jgi:hypothetical protein
MLSDAVKRLLRPITALKLSHNCGKNRIIKEKYKFRLTQQSKLKLAQYGLLSCTELNALHDKRWENLDGTEGTCKRAFLKQK